MFWLMAISALILAAMQGQSAPALNPQSEQAIDALFAPWNRTDTPGMVVGVARGGEFVYRKAFGMARLEPAVKLSADDALSTGSLAKQFTAAMILLLEQEGKLSLDDPIQKHIRQFPDSPESPRIRHLLSHTDGIRDFHWLLLMRGLDIGDAYSDSDVLRVICRQRSLNFRPGSEFSYGNSGYFLLAEIIERASGQGLNEFAQEHLFGPLGMRDTVLAEGAGSAVGYSGSEGGGFTPVPNQDLTLGSKGLVITLENFLRWHQHLMSGEEWVQKLINPVTPNRYAMGIYNSTWRGERVLDHAGEYAGHRARAMLFPDQGVSVFVFSNHAQAGVEALAEQVAEIVLAKPRPATLIRPAAAPVTTPKPEVSHDQLEKWTGDYYSDEVEAEHRVRLEGGRLTLAVGRRKYDLVPNAAGEFVCPLGRITFDREGYVIHGSRVRAICFRRR